MFGDMTIEKLGQKKNYRYYSVPMELFTDTRFQDISNDAKLLYAILLDRCTLARKYDWHDEAGRIFVTFTISDAQELLNVGRTKAVKLFGELTRIGLIDKHKPDKRNGSQTGNAAIIYVKDFRVWIDCGENVENYNGYKTVNGICNDNVTAYVENSGERNESITCGKRVESGGKFSTVVSQIEPCGVANQTVTCRKSNRRVSQIRPTSVANQTEWCRKSDRVVSQMRPTYYITNLNQPITSLLTRLITRQINQTVNQPETT